MQRLRILETRKAVLPNHGSPGSANGQARIGFNRPSNYPKLSIKVAPPTAANAGLLSAFWFSKI
jgi:hypothetical protein